MTKPRRYCEVEGCVAPRHGQGYCNRHYKRWKAYGDPLVTKLATEDDSLFWRLARYTLVGDDCWEWVGNKRNKSGYGTMMYQGKPRMAHRLWYEEMRGEIPLGLHVDHLCRNTSCVNPWHLEAVTPAENNRRKSHCPTCRCKH